MVLSSDFVDYHTIILVVGCIESLVGDVCGYLGAKNTGLDVDDMSSVSRIDV